MEDSITRARCMVAAKRSSCRQNQKDKALKVTHRLLPNIYLIRLLEHLINPSQSILKEVFCPLYSLLYSDLHFPLWPRNKTMWMAHPTTVPCACQRVNYAAPGARASVTVLKDVKKPTHNATNFSAPSSLSKAPGPPYNIASASNSQTPVLGHVSFGYTVKRNMTKMKRLYTKSHM